MGQNSVCGGQGPERRPPVVTCKRQFNIWICSLGEKIRRDIKLGASSPLKCHLGEFPGGPVVRTSCCHCRRHGFDPR